MHWRKLRDANCRFYSSFPRFCKKRQHIRIGQRRGLMFYCDEIPSSHKMLMDEKVAFGRVLLDVLYDRKRGRLCFVWTEWKPPNVFDREQVGRFADATIKPLNSEWVFFQLLCVTYSWSKGPSTLRFLTAKRITRDATLKPLSPRSSFNDCELSTRNLRLPLGIWSISYHKQSFHKSMENVIGFVCLQQSTFRTQRAHKTSTYNRNRFAGKMKYRIILTVKSLKFERLGVLRIDRYALWRPNSQNPTAFLVLGANRKQMENLKQFSQFENRAKSFVPLS